MYSDEVMRNARQNLGLEDPEDTSRDQEILSMPKLELLEKCLNWEGIIGYSRIILGFVQGIYGVNLESSLD